MAISQNFPTIRPALNLNFARTKTLDPRITFSRASIATYVGADGLIKTAAIDEPRFDHNPVTKTSLGLLVEESKTNYLTNSDNLSGFPVQTNVVVTTNAAAAPNGLVQATRLANNTVDGLHRLYINATGLNTGLTTFSVFAKAETANFIQLSAGNSTGTFYQYQATFDLSNGTVSDTQAQNGGKVIYSITSYGNGWYRCSVGHNLAQGIINAQVHVLENSSVSINPGYTGTNKSILVWGSQIEGGSFSTSYIPTTNATVTRLVDNAVISGPNFASLYNPNKFTLYGEGRSITKGQSESTDLYALVSIDDNTAANRFTLRRSADVYQNTGYSGFNFRYRRTSISLNLDAFPPLVDSSGNLPLWNNSNIHKAIFAVNNNSQVPHDIAAYGDGVNANLTAQGQTYLGTEILSSFTAATQLSIGNAPGANPFNGHVTKIMYYPERLPNNQLQSLTK